MHFQEIIIDIVADLLNFSPVEILYHGIGHYAPGGVIGPACWPHWDLLVVLRGLVIVEAGRRSFSGRYRLEEGDAILLPPGRRFRGTGQTPQSTIWVLHFRDRKLRARARIRDFRQAAGDAFARGMLTEIAHVYLKGPKPVRDPYLLALVAALLEKLRRKNPQPSQKPGGDARLHFWRIEDLETQTDGPLPTAAGLAAAAGLSVSHHRALFARQYGLSPGCHLRQLRVVYARKLLKETQLPIKRIAMSAGYKDTVSFHRAFAKTCGCTPGKFRKKHPPIV